MFWFGPLIGAAITAIIYGKFFNHLMEQYALSLHLPQHLPLELSRL